MDRRSFVRAGLAAVAAGAVVRPRIATAEPATGLDFDFTGLYAFQIGETSKQLRVILVDGPAAGIEDEHAPLLVMRCKDYEPSPAGVDPSALHHGPKLVRLGGQLLAVWSLAGSKLWIGNAHTAFDDEDSSATLTVDDSSIDGRTKPCPLHDTDGWRSMKWFAQYEHLLGGDYESGSLEIAFDPQCVASMIRLTRGHVSGRMPLTECERERTYCVAGSSASRTFNNQFHCVYQHDAGQTVLAVSRVKESSDKPRFIGVRIGNVGLTPVSVVNTSLTHHYPRHYEAFYAMACATGRSIEFPLTCGGSTRSNATVARVPAHQSSAVTPKLDSPDPDCIPPRARLA